MSDDNSPDGVPDDQNPFKGTPFEEIFKQMGEAMRGSDGPVGFVPPGFVPSGAAGANAEFDLGAMFSQVQRMFAEPGEGPVNFTLARDTARHVLASEGADPTPHSGQESAARDALALAEGWLDRATSLPAATLRPAVWSRADWIEESMPTWEVLVSPIAGHVVESMSDALPAEAQAMAGPLLGILQQLSGSMFGQQVGQGVAGLATEVLSSTDIGLPLASDGVAAVVPANLADFATAHSLTPSDALIYVMLREAAHLRLFAHATWLRPAVVGAIEEFGRGTTIDTSSIEEKLQNIDPTNPEAMQEAMSQGLFDPQPTPEQQRAKDRLELLLALIEGWVDHVVTQATADTMPAAAALAETMRRRRASGGPAEETFATLVGLELRPRRLRDAANLWAAIAAEAGPEARDAVWSHPDLTPTIEDLDDPLGYRERRAAAQADAEAFDSALEKLLENPSSHDADET